MYAVVTSSECSGNCKNDRNRFTTVCGQAAFKERNNKGFYVSVVKFMRTFVVASSALMAKHIPIWRPSVF